MVDVRAMHSGEADVLGQVMWDAIHGGRSLYTPAQRNAWLADPPVGEAWAKKLAAQSVWVAVESGVPIGFITLATGGYIDLAFVMAAGRGRGVFSALFVALEHEVIARRMPRLWTHASLMAEPAFAAKGFHVIAREMVDRAGQTLARAEMEKMLT